MFPFTKIEDFKHSLKKIVWNTQIMGFHIFFFVKSRMKNEVLVNTICHAIVLLAASFRLQKIFRVCLASFVLCDENDFSEYYSPTTDYCNQSKVVLKRSLKREVKQNYKWLKSGFFHSESNGNRYLGISRCHFCIVCLQAFSTFLVNSYRFLLAKRPLAR